MILADKNKVHIPDTPWKFPVLLHFLRGKIWDKYKNNIKDTFTDFSRLLTDESHCQWGSYLKASKIQYELTIQIKKNSSPLELQFTGSTCLFVINRPKKMFNAWVEHSTFQTQVNLITKNMTTVWRIHRKYLKLTIILI